MSVPFCTQSALQAICSEIEKHGLPEQHRRQDIWKEGQELLGSPEMSRYGPFFKTCSAVTTAGTMMDFLHVNFLSLLAGLFYKGGHFTDFLLQLHAAHPSTMDVPWDLICYCDEMQPGNQLSSTSRKAWCCYLSFLQFRNFLGRENMWFCTFILRTTEVAKLEAGISQVVKLVLEDLFCDGTPQCGILLSSAKGTIRLFFKFTMVLQDGGAQKQFWSSRQDTGSKPCYLCKNIFALRGQEDAVEEGGDNVFSKFLKRSQLQVANNAEIIASWQRLAIKQENLTVQEFQKWQQATGTTYNKYALMASEKLLACGVLQPATSYCFDWMHGMCSGVMQETVFLVFESLHHAGYNVWDLVHRWLGFWMLPHGHSNVAMSKLFDAEKVKRDKKAKAFRVSASEMLTLCKPLQYFLQSMYLSKNIMVEQCNCFILWADVVDYLSSIAFLPAPDPDKLQHLVEKALQGTVNAGFGSSMKPKHHWTLHYSDCLRRWKTLPSCWAMERKHKTPRQFGSSHCNLQGYEKGLLSAVSIHHMNVLLNDEKVFHTGCYLVDPRPLPKGLEAKLKEWGYFLLGMQYAKTSKLKQGSTCTIGDVVFFGSNLQLAAGLCNWQCGKVKHFLAIPGFEFCLLEHYTFVQTRANTHASTWHTTNAPLELLDLKDIWQPVVYSFGKNGTMICLTPAPLSCS